MTTTKSHQLCSEPWCLKDALPGCLQCAAHIDPNATTHRANRRSEPAEHINEYTVNCRDCGRGPAENHDLGLRSGGWIKTTRDGIEAFAKMPKYQKCGACGGRMLIEADSDSIRSGSFNPAVITRLDRPAQA